MSELSYDEILHFLQMPMEEAEQKLFPRALQKKRDFFGDDLYVRALIELSNQCQKNCSYCGIRRDLPLSRFAMTDEEVWQKIQYARSLKFNAFVIQSGERTDDDFIEKIGRLLRKIRETSDPALPFTQVTLSCGEQAEDVYRFWRDCGAFRYLLRIEVSDRSLYEKLHPQDGLHDYHERIRCLQSLKKLNYKTGTGVLVGVPGQSLENLAHDLLFFKKMNIDMIGLGPFIEHSDVSLKASSSVQQRVELTLKMMAVARLLMGKINIASTTALQTLDPSGEGRVRGIMAGANVFMPNVTHLKYRENYNLYQGKVHLADEPEAILQSLAMPAQKTNSKISFYEEII